jgi:DNA-directed RNA polymerase specialized sigma24 family protein
MAIYEGHIRAFTGGDRAANRVIYDELATRVYVFAHGFVRQKDWAAAIMRASFVKLFVAHARLTSENAIANFLYLAARNACLNELRDIKTYIEESNGDLARRIMDVEDVYRLHKKLQDDKLRF